MRISPFARWTMGIGIALLIVVVPFVYYRMTYGHSKRLRVATEGVIYRSGCMTADGFRQAIQKHKIRTVINLMNEAVDPALPESFFSTSDIRESELCKQMGVNFLFLSVDLVHPSQMPAKRPATIERFLELMDNPANHPVLVHCKAGLHRTGCLLALYRMEYEGWTKDEALRELKAHGFGELKANAANDYIMQYILAYQPRPRDTDGNLLPHSTGRSVQGTPVGRTR